MSQTTSKRSSSSPSSSSTSTLTSSASSEATSYSSSSNALATRASSTSSSTKTSHSQVGGWLAEKIHDSFLTCRLCFEAYTSPKCLSCLHTFCEGCIENLLHESDLLLAYRKYSTTDYREVVCPICRKRTQVPLGGVRRLPDNFLVEGLSETLVRQKPPKFPLCDICKLVNKKDKDASSKCLECQRMMCQDCLVLHGQTRVTSGHTIFDVEIEKEIECKDHEDEIVRFYCDTCSSCICIMCTFNEHREHEIIGFQEAASKHQGRVKNMADICKKHLIGSERELEALESCESLITSVEQFIKHKAEEMLTEIKYREKHLIDQLKKIYGKQCLDRIAKKKELILKMEESKSACKLVDAILAGKEIEFLLLRNKVEEKLETLNKTPRKKLPSTVGKAVEFRPGSLNFGYLYDYDEPKSVDKNNSTAATENEDKKKRRSKTAIEINYVTAFYGGGQIHTCSVDTQTDPVDFKKIGGDSKTKKTQTVDVSKKKNTETTNSVAETNEPTIATTTVTPATPNPDTIPPTNLPATTNITTTTTTATNTAEAKSSSQQPTASSLTQHHKTTQNKATVRPSSSSTSPTTKGSSSSSSASSSSSSSSSQIQRISDKDTQNKSSQQQNTSTDRPKLRRTLKHIGSSVESFSSYDDDGNVFTQDENQFCNPLSKIETKTKIKLSSLSSISSSSPKQSSSSPSSLLSRNANVSIVPSLITSNVPTTASSVTSQKSSPTMSSDTNVEEKIMDSKTSPSVSLTSKNAPPASTNVETIPKSVATTIQKSATTQQNPSTTTTTQSFATSPRNVVIATNNISLPSKVQQLSLSTSTSNILKPALSTSSSSSSAPATPKPLPQVTSSSSSSLNQGLVSTPANTINVNSTAHKMETKLQPVQQPATKNQIKAMPVVLKSSLSSSASSSSVVTSSLQASLSLTLPQSVLSSPLLSKSPLTSQSAVPQSVASSSSSSTRPTALSPSTVRVPQQTNSPITNVVSATSTNCVISPVLNSPVSSSSSASLIQTSPSRSQAIAITTQMTPTGGSKIVATIAPMTSAIKTASSSSSSMTSLPNVIKTDPPSKNDSETTEFPKDKPSQPSTTQTTATTQSSTTSIATPSNDSGRVAYRKKPKEMTHLSDSPIFKHPYSFVEAGSQRGGAYPSRHAPPLYNQPSSYLRHNHVPHTSSSGSPASHRMSDGSLYGQHKFY